MSDFLPIREALSLVGGAVGARASSALDRVEASWTTKGELLAKSAVRIVELDQHRLAAEQELDAAETTVRQQSKFAQEQHAYIVELEAALAAIADPRGTGAFTSLHQKEIAREALAWTPGHPSYDEMGQ